MAWQVPQNGLVALELAAEHAADELLAALPQRVRDVFSDARWRVIEASALFAVTPAVDDRPVALALPAHEFLLRRIELPLTARLQLADLMRFEASRHVPLPPDQARLDFRIVSRDLAASRMVVELAIIRAAVVEEAHRSAKAAGFEPEAVAIGAGSLVRAAVAGARSAGSMVQCPPAPVGLARSDPGCAGIGLGVGSAKLGWPHGR